MTDTFDRRDGVLAAQRAAIVATVLVAGLAANAGTADRFSLLRATLFACIAILLLGCSAARAATERRLVLPRTWVWIPILGFAVALTIAVISSPQTMRSLIGPYTRYTGMTMYVVYIVLFGFVLRCHGAKSIQKVAQVSALVLGLVAVYGLAQFAGIDPIGWPEGAAESGFDLPTEFATFGNVNFASGFVGILAPLPAWVGVSSARAQWQRIAGVTSCVLAGFYLMLLGSAQGLLAYAAGLGFFGLVYVLDRWAIALAWARKRRLVVAGGLALAVPGSAGAVAFAARQLGDAGTRERWQLWETAIDLWSQKPLLGHGLGSFEWLFTANRPADHAEQNNFLQADAPHNVFLDMAVGGGAVLFLAYAAVVLSVGAVLVRGLRSSAGKERVLLAAFGGSWLGYQVQSLVSIDVPPIAAMHWLLAGGVIVLARPPVALAIPLGPSPVTGARKGRSRRPRRTVNWRTAVAVAVICMMVAWPVTRPLRADRASALAADALGRGDLQAELDEASRAVELAPWEGRYRAQQAAAYDHLKRLPQAREVGVEAATRSPGSSLYALAIAGLSVRLNDPEEARRWLSEALQRDPHNPKVQSAVQDTEALLRTPAED